MEALYIFIIFGLWLILYKLKKIENKIDKEK